MKEGLKSFKREMFYSRPEKVISNFPNYTLSDCEKPLAATGLVCLMKS